MTSRWTDVGSLVGAAFRPQLSKWFWLRKSCFMLSDHFVFFFFAVAQFTILPLLNIHSWVMTIQHESFVLWPRRVESNAFRASSPIATTVSRSCRGLSLMCKDIIPFLNFAYDRWAIITSLISLCKLNIVAVICSCWCLCFFRSPASDNVARPAYVRRQCASCVNLTPQLRAANQRHWRK